MTDWHAKHLSRQLDLMSREEHISALESNHDMLNEVWTPMLESKTAQDLGAEPNLVRRLLDWFWVWPYPLHNYLYKPCFVMEMALGGPYYSKFLLHCILALSARHLEAGSADHALAEKGEQFLSTAKELLMQELGATKPRIPTIQGLLVLGGRQCAVGKTSEVWLYTGMAIRMMTDLGLHLSLQGSICPEKMTPNEFEVRKRLYCSAYIWDKTLSLSLGRPSALTRLPSNALDFLDHTEDQHAWLPPEYLNYPNNKSYQTACFAAFCCLGVIIELVMSPLPRSISARIYRERLECIQSKLCSWYDELPMPLRTTSGCETCPPPNILSLNMLYHTLYTILWRSYLNLLGSKSHATTMCTSTTQTVHYLFVVYGQTFHWKKISYLLSY